MSKRVAVHQPNFAPWSGYFAKMFAVDEFVFFDDTQMPNRGYVNRVKIARGKDAEQWLSAPVRRASGQAIREVEFVEEPWHVAHLKTLQLTYGRSEFSAQTRELVEPLFDDPGPTLAGFNMRLIETVARHLGWEGTFHRSSDHPADLLADERLAQLTAAVGGTTYVSGAGGENYQSESTFAAQGVELEVRKYAPIEYARSGWPWVPGLSILDALFHQGPAARDVLRYA
jgi:hypothetical protein